MTLISALRCLAWINYLSFIVVVVLSTAFVVVITKFNCDTELLKLKHDHIDWLFFQV